MYLSHLQTTIPNTYLQQLVKISLVSSLNIKYDGYKQPLKSSMDFLNPKRHTPPTNPTNDMNMSLVEGYTFAVCRSIKNIQILTECGGVNKFASILEKLTNTTFLLYLQVHLKTDH